MDLSYSEEQQLLEDTVTRFVQERYELKQRDAYLQEAAGYSRDNWQILAEMGLLGVLRPEAEGGFGGGPAETMIVMKALGRGLVVEPFWSSVVLVDALMGDHGQRGSVADGEQIIAPALYEPSTRHHLDTLACKVDGLAISGTKSLVFAADSADAFVVAARDSCAGAGVDAIGLYLVPADAAGVHIRAYPTQDGSRAAEVSFENSPLSACVHQPGQAWPVLERAFDLSVAALCAEYVGVAEVAFELTHDYVQVREQFGRPIGKFQVIQHALVDMRTALEEASAMAISAARDAADDDPVTRARGVSAAKARIGEASRFIAQQAVQIHGGIGMTHEYGVGRYVKRLTVLDLLFGDTDYHADRFSRLMSL